MPIFNILLAKSLTLSIPQTNQDKGKTNGSDTRQFPSPPRHHHRRRDKIFISHYTHLNFSLPHHFHKNQTQIQAHLRRQILQSVTHHHHSATEKMDSWQLEIENGFSAPWIPW